MMIGYGQMDGCSQYRLKTFVHWYKDLIFKYSLTLTISIENG
jgi:hypothetical protein